MAERRGNWSWTDDVELARGYAEGTAARRPKGALWQAVVEPCRLLARNTINRPGESEYVVDTEGLTITEVLHR